MKDRRRWDILDIAGLVDAALEGFSQEFYGKNFASITNGQAARILNAIHQQIAFLKEAQR